MTMAATHSRTSAAHDSAMTAQDSLAGLREATAAARAEAGRLLACLRHAAGLSQVRLAGRIGYSATAVAHAERGCRPVSAEFWELADEALGAGGRLTAWGARIKHLTRARRQEQQHLDKTRHTARLSEFLPQPHQDDTTIAVPVILSPATSTSAAGRCPHCHLPVTLVVQITAPPDTGTRAGPGEDCDARRPEARCV